MKFLKPVLFFLLLAVNAVAAGELLRAAMPLRAPTPAADALTHPRAVVVGLDGVDFRWLSRYLEEDLARPEGERRLPTFHRLRELGGLHVLRSETPPESPVAWASVITGVNPGRHGVFDFVRPGTGYRPMNGMVSVRRMRLLGGRIPIRPPLVRSRLASPTFLERVQAAGYPVVALRQPLLFPVRPLPGAKLLSGLGTPDIAGGPGFYAVWGSSATFPSGDTIFAGVQIPLDPDETQRWETALPGPVDPTLPRGDGGALARTTVPLAFEITESEGRPALAIRLAGREEIVPVGARSPFMVVPFDLGTWPKIRIRGHVRFEVKGLNPVVVLADPVNIYAPDSPMPISSPPSFAGELWERYGPFETMGWTEQTFAMNDLHQDDEGFLRDLMDDLNSGAGLLLGELARGGRCVFQVFTPTDRGQHCFYRYYDKDHPGYVPGRMEALGDPVLQLHERCDQILGDVLEQLDPEDLLLVCSDHGFQSFRWGVSLNKWLVEKGYMKLRKEVVEQNLATFLLSGDLGADAIDWAHTRAYAMGLGQIYINRVGREEQGIVEAGDVTALVEEIANSLKEIQNPLRPDDVPVLEVYRLGDIYHGPETPDAAEIQVGFGPGYRVSWQTALLGGMGKALFVPNLRAWSGDHCSNDVSTVPGILLANKRIPPAPEGHPYQVQDVAATIVDWFGLDTSDLDGRPVPVERAPGGPARAER